MENRKRSCTCGRPLEPRRRKYCALCARKAARMAQIRWKRENRALNREAYRRYRDEAGLRRGEDDLRGAVPYWLEPWAKKACPGETPREAYNAFMRRYMRHRRERRAAEAC